MEHLRLQLAHLTFRHHALGIRRQHGPLHAREEAPGLRLTEAVFVFVCCFDFVLGAVVFPFACVCVLCLPVRYFLPVARCSSARNNSW